jgi:hypothetical protein
MRSLHSNACSAVGTASQLLVRGPCVCKAVQKPLCGTGIPQQQQQHQVQQLLPSKHVNTHNRTNDSRDTSFVSRSISILCAGVLVLDSCCPVLAAGAAAAPPQPQQQQHSLLGRMQKLLGGGHQGMACDFENTSTLSCNCTALPRHNCTLLYTSKGALHSCPPMTFQSVVTCISSPGVVCNLVVVMPSPS